MPAWTVQQSDETYGIQRWGDGYFKTNALGHVTVKPFSNQTEELDLHEIAKTLLKQGLSFPILIRFTDILRDRVETLQQAFLNTSKAHNFQGNYTPVYPIKVNQHDKVVEGILAADGVGLEAGSKPELLAILGLSKQSKIICNGYKDRAYIRLALIGLQLGFDLYIVIEKPSELELIIEQSDSLKIKPQLGVRIRLSSISAGKWQNSGGEKSKFGFHAADIIKLIKRLKQLHMLDSLKLMHFHMGSQVSNIHDIKQALREAGQYYHELNRLGANISIVDVGGGLGVDYEGTRSRRECSINYSMTEYADNIIRCFVDVCAKHLLPHPDIITESGRAMAAHHAVLITNVIDIETQAVTNPGEFKPFNTSVEEVYHNTQFAVQEARIQFTQGELSLEQFADLEKQHGEQCLAIQQQLNPKIRSHEEISVELDSKLADKVFCNFSVFQSMPDIWGINQIFPIMPIHRLDEKPTRRAVIQDLTCDSDGRIDAYIDGQNIEKTLPLHTINLNEPYLIGFFLVGAYQEILGDMHNLFGDTHSINIELKDDGYHCTDFIKGEKASEVLDYVHINAEDLKSAYQKKLAETQLSAQQKADYEQELMAGLTAYTYLEK